MRQRRPLPPRFFGPYDLLIAPEAPAAAARRAGGRAACERSDRDTLDIASFPGHGNEATLDCQKAQARAFTQLVRYTGHNYHAHGVGG